MGIRLEVVMGIRLLSYKLRVGLLSLAVVLAGVLVPTSPTHHVRAAQSVRFRVASLAPRGSIWDRAYQAWANSVQQQTEGRAHMQFYLGGSQGDERDYIRKMQSGQLDGAGISTTGLSQLVRPVLVLSLPGLFRDYGDLARVRAELHAEFEEEFAKAGFTFLAWADVGRARMFSRQPIVRPADLKEVRPWAWRDDIIFNEFLRVVGANGQRTGVNELLPALQTRRVDAFPASALAAVSLQWHNHITHVSKQSDAVLIGATVLRKDKFDTLSAADKRVVKDTARRAHQMLTRTVQQADDRAYRAILKRGVIEVDTSAHEAEWREASRQVRERLAGRLYPEALLRRVESLAIR